MYDSIILVNSKAELNIVFDLYNELMHIGKKVLIVTTDNVNVSDKRYFIRGFQYYQNFFPSNSFDIEQKASDLFYSLAKEEVSNNLSLQKLTMYKGVSLWELSVHYVFVELFLILSNFNMLEAVLNTEEPSEVYVINDINRLKEMLGLLCKERKISFFVRNKTNKRILDVKKFFCKFIVLARKIKRFFVSLRFLFSRLIKFKNLNKKYKVIFFSSVGRYLNSILPVMLKYNNEQRLVVDPSLGSSKTLKEFGIDYMDFYGYSLYDPFNLQTRGLLKRIQDTINKNAFFDRKVQYKGVYIGRLLVDTFERLICEIFPDNIQKINAIRRITSLHRPEVVAVINYSPDIVLTAKSLSIATVAIQNGFINELCFFGGSVIADAVTVEGNYWKEYLLRKKDIDSNRIYVTGSAKFDAIIKNRFNIKDSSKMLNLDPTKKTVIFAGSGRTDFGGTDLNIGILKDEKIKQLESVYIAMRNIREANLIVKLHPYENDFNLYEKMAKEVDLKDYTLIRDIEILKLLHNCDLLITQVSTVGYEAVLLDKNVISLCGSSNFLPDDIWDFKKYGAAINIYHLEELESYIRKALFDSETIAELKRGREEYIMEHAYKLDGNASSRVKEVIDSFLSN